jgi:ParB family chromosome partitioning protein
MAKKSALGKGLGALISGFDGNYEPHTPAIVTSAVQTSAVSISEIDLDKIETNPYQPRTVFEEEALEALSDSIKQLGLIQPITVRSTEDGKYQIISGERRFRAAKMAGLTHIPAYIRKANDQGMLEMAIVENIQRENLDSIEVALSFQRLIEECDLTQEEMAERVGKKRATVTNYLRLLKLPAQVQLDLRQSRITMGHAKCILSLENPAQQLQLCELVIKNDLSVRQTEQKVKELLNPTPKKEKKPVDLPDSHYRVLEIVGRYFHNKISLKRDEKGKGSITIQFANDDEIQTFLKDLEGIKQS